jgi:hypothetical protein
VEERVTVAEKSAQKALDAQGYLIVGALIKRRSGEVLEAAKLHRHDRIERLKHPLVVIGTATRAEYEAQCRTVYGHAPRLAPRPYYYKVIAE